MGIDLIKKAIIVIPARLESKRLPNKLLENLDGKTIIQRVIEQCLKSFKRNQIILCTDSQELFLIAENLGIKAIITSSKCKSGSERIASVIDELVNIAWHKKDSQNNSLYEIDKKESTLIINVQGDQPFLDPNVLKEMKDYCFNSNKLPKLVTPIYKLKKEQIHNPAVVKTLINQNKKAIYFSRSAIPYVRDQKKEDWHLHNIYWGHVGIYGYRADILSNWNNYPISNLEKSENLEQLRIIDAGIEISTFQVEGDFLSIDTMDQLDYARNIIKQRQKNQN